MADGDQDGDSQQLSSQSPLAWLTAHGVDPGGDLCKVLRTNRGFLTPIMLACSASELGVCQWLIEHGAAPTIRTKDSSGRTPMYTACWHGQLRIAKWLYEIGAAADIRVKSNFGGTPMLAACEKGHLDVMMWLYEVGAAEDIRVKSTFGSTPMFYACMDGRLDVAKWLFKVGAAEDIRTKNNQGSTPIYIACSYGHRNMAKWLYASGAIEDTRVKNVDGYNPMMIACQRGGLQLVKWLFEVGAADDIHTRSNSGATPLIIAQDCEISSWLILQGACNDGNGHIAADILERDARNLTDISFALSDLIDQHALFSRLVIPAATLSLSHLTLLSGHEETILALIADFLGVIRGRLLRNAREAVALMLSIEL